MRGSRPIRCTRRIRIGRYPHFVHHRPCIGVCKASNIWLAQAFDLYARPIKYRLNFNALDPALPPILHPLLVCVRAFVWAPIFSPPLLLPSLYTRHVHTDRQTAAYPPTNLSAETQYGTPVAILFTKFTYARRYTYAWKMSVVIGIPFRIHPFESIRR